MATRSPLEAALIAVLACLIIAGVAVLAWYHVGPGWTKFSFAEGDYASWAPAAGTSVGNLRFRNAMFTITPATGGTSTGLPVSENVTGILNRMARGFEGLTSDSSPPAPPVLALARPLNAFSFPITGLTDGANGAAFATKYTGGAPPACSAESDCAPGGKAAAYPTGWATSPAPVPAPAPATDPTLVVPGQTAPANFMCTRAATNMSSGSACQTPPPASATPPSPANASDGCGISYAATGTCFRAATNPTTTLTGEYRSFKTL